MVSLNKRCTFQVGQDPANERTLTLSSSSNEGYFVSLRPFIAPKDSEKQFPFEWAFAGGPASARVEKKDDKTDVVYFDFDFDTNVHLNAENTHRGTITTYWKKWESGLVEERGQVFPFGTEKEGVDFFELWQPVDVDQDALTILSDKSPDQDIARSVVLTVDNADYKGLVVAVGRWAQGILFKKNEHSIKGVNFLRSVELANGQWETQFEYGTDADRFPQKFIASKGSTFYAKSLSWEVIESNFQE
ncbi:LANO_0F02982g1_1 [Lachancea nothofagi CBS 11611]|uniref:Protein HRI1 n=1 Tax=Lachancea nothofagi CBS 11611 TaxID=1266666 RepID=A0A1G4K6Z2_9SACH|nr:LANO_0F02982g1_1 [Lachancea nothofagi CBS 11611]